VVFGLTPPSARPKKDKRAAELSEVKWGGGYIENAGEYVPGVNIPALLKDVADEMNIRLLEAIESSDRRAKDYLDEVSELT
jgi:hypothetical protein